MVQRVDLCLATLLRLWLWSWLLIRICPRIALALPIHVVYSLPTKQNKTNKTTFRTRKRNAVILSEYVFSFALLGFEKKNVGTTSVDALLANHFERTQYECKMYGHVGYE